MLRIAPPRGELLLFCNKNAIIYLMKNEHNAIITDLDDYRADRRDDKAVENYKVIMRNMHPSNYQNRKEAQREMQDRPDLVAQILQDELRERGYDDGLVEGVQSYYESMCKGSLQYSKAELSNHLVNTYQELLATTEAENRETVDTAAEERQAERERQKALGQKAIGREHLMLIRSPSTPNED